MDGCMTSAVGGRCTAGQAHHIVRWGWTIVRWVKGGGSFLASHDRRIIFGLGQGPVPSSLSVEVRWPNGEIQRVSNLSAQQYHRIVESSSHRPK
jgi:hypothetical protein